MRFKKLFILLCLFHSAFFLEAQEAISTNYYTVKNYADEWLVYDEEQKNYVPYLTEEHANELSVNVLLEIENNRYYDLLVYVEKDNYLFFNGSLQKRLLGGTWQRFKIDSLSKLYPKPQLLLTLYGSPGKTGKTVLIGHKKITAEKPITIEEAADLQLRPKERSSISNFFTLSMLLLVGFAAFLMSSYPRAFERFYNFYDLLSTDPRDESFLVNKPFSRVNLLFLVLVSLLLTYLFFFVESKQYPLLAFKQFVNIEKTLGENWLDFILVSAVVFLFLIAKYVGIFILGSLYQLDNIIKRHYFKAIQSLLLFYTLVAVVVSVASLYVLDWRPLIQYFLIVPSIIFYLMRAVLLFFTIRSTVTVKNLYVISYLCIAELVPLIIGVRYAL
ncbi:MAG: DUF4271 domain-containing protein [Runella slithyformis]|nr:MAG: DUF4271 domain-containing protein [Runella slithyformis]